jgi:hypothetical protein
VTDAPSFRHRPRFDRLKLAASPGCRFLSATNSATTRSFPCSARAAWERSTAPAIRRSSATLHSKSCPRRSCAIPIAWLDFNAKPKCGSLDHPNIGPIHGIVDSDDSRGLVLALIEGPTLADRIEAGPIPLDEAVAISKQIIEALEYAHDRGVVHRDLKPANIKITSEGVVKVLDFGLAKVLEDEPPPSLSNSPTLTLGHTRTGVILGTASYMSPEQAVGRPVDRRTDIFSLGAVLYEMLTGKRAFTGATTPDVLEAVVKNDPDWSALPAGMPGYLRRLLKRMLAKDRKQRLQAIGEARIALQNPAAHDVSQAPMKTDRSRLAWSLAAALAVGLILSNVYWWRASRPALQPLMRLDIDLGPEHGRRILFPTGCSATVSRCHPMAGGWCTSSADPTASGGWQCDHSRADRRFLSPERRVEAIRSFLLTASGSGFSRAGNS